jgi:hypothetical protein
MYQIPVKPQGVYLICKYLFWPVSMINLTMHKIGNEGLQIIIREKLLSASKSEV